MEEKTITQEVFDKAVEALQEESYKEYNLAVLAVRAVFGAAGITVEPPPILPGATSGEWEYRQAKNNTWEVFVKKKGSIELDGTTGDIHIGWVCGKTNVEVMAGSKKLVELVVAWIEGKDHWHFREPVKAIIEQLVVMGANVSELEEVE